MRTWNGSFRGVTFLLLKRDTEHVQGLVHIESILSRILRGWIEKGEC